MFCPDCGMENTNSQKFCRRCGANLAALESARKVISDLGTTNKLHPTVLLSALAGISIAGFFCVTLMVLVLSKMQYDHANADFQSPPIGLFAGVIGYLTLILLCRPLIKLLKQEPPSATQQFKSKLAQITGASPAKTNRSLNEAVPPQSFNTDSDLINNLPNSVIEEDTRHLVAQQRPQR